jgi:cytochrome P450
VTSTPFTPVPLHLAAKPVPGERGGLPLVGITTQLMSDPLGLRRQQYDRYGPVTWYKAFGERQVAMLGPDAAEVVAVNRDKAFGQGWEPILGTFFERGLLLLDFEEHLHHRRVAQQAFSPERLRGYLARMQPGIAREIGSWPTGERFLTQGAAKRLLLDAATETFVGIPLGADADRVNAAFLDAVRAAYSMFRFPFPGNRWSKGLRGRRFLEQHFTGLIPGKRAGSDDDLFSALCQAATEEGARFTDTDVVNHLVFLMMASHEITTSTLCSMIYFLGAHPEWQNRLREESFALGEHLGYDELDRLGSCDLVMKESTRLFPPITELARRTVKDTEVLGHFIPAGTPVQVPVHFVHHMPEYWPSPTTWDPLRFSEERREDKNHRYAWMPFGGGVHKCIGMHFATVQVKAVLHLLVRNFSWRLPAGYQLRTDWSRPPVPKDGLPIILTPVN